MSRARLLCAALAGALGTLAAADSPPAAPVPPPGIDSAWLDREWLAHLMWRADRLAEERNAAGVEFVCREALRLAPAYAGAVERLRRQFERNGELELELMARLHLAELEAPDAQTPLDAETLALARLNQLRDRAQPPANPEERERREDDLEMIADLVADDLHHGRLAEAERRLRDALRSRPGDPKLLLDLGSVYVRGQDWGLCAMLFQLAHRLHPEDPDFANNLATALGKLDRHAAALTLLERQLERRPDSPFLLENCGVLATRLGDVRRALRHFSRWIELEPANPRAWLKYGAVLVEMGPEKYLFAKVAFRRVLETDPGNRMALYYLAAVDTLRGDPDAAADWLLKLGPFLGPDRLAEILREAPFREQPALLSLPARLRLEGARP
jgi:Flp pilus assembly protein TadD